MKSRVKRHGVAIEENGVGGFKFNIIEKEPPYDVLCLYVCVGPGNLPNGYLEFLFFSSEYNLAGINKKPDLNLLKYAFFCGISKYKF